MSEPDIITVCPNCDSPNLRTSGGGMSRFVDHDYRCKDCKHTFDDPKERPREIGHYTSGLSRKLEESDPDDLGLSPVEPSPDRPAT